MKCRSIAVVALLVSLAYAGPALAQNSKAVTTMASILMTVNHFPNDEQKKTLTALAAEPTTTAQEKVLISALVGMQHSVRKHEASRSSRGEGSNGIGRRVGDRDDPWPVPPYGQ
jgi:hypothetical protein